ncbi:metal ABC transporter permease [Methylobacterium nonmethylotrophicum]|uniref:Metal ABC transporter permease n=1 Tax=Methylobacterium nonmethylotrophicum TaxID=1141884 RepID=A0A4Z0NJJ3_9HYPH|nr:metal ABC transporter permease [Methylobacterium nonmethylotrophicum]TGD96497.1 metal ABC transporter permease [Methylobacterium nonmethylotrophicum]
MLRTIAAAGLALAASGTLAASIKLAIGVALAAPQVERLRGTIERVEGDAVTIRTRAGATETIRLVPGTRVALLAPASLDQVRDGSFIGTAAKAGPKPGDPPVALEVLIFPEALRGTGEGHGQWDRLPDGAGSFPVETTMTNGTVKAQGPETLVETTMTNGTVAGAAGAGAGRTITVSYKGQSLAVAVPPGTPIVTLEPADRAALVPGAKVFASATRDGDRLEARSISVGKDGLTPPM